MDDKVEGTAGSDPGHCGGGRGRRQSDRPGSREKGGPDGGCGQAECAAV